MKKPLLIISLLLFGLFSSAQELITNGNFSSPSISPWAATASSAGLNGWFGPGAAGCGQTTNNSYAWFGDINEQTGVDNLSEGLYQQISIPANSSSVTLSFRVSISTLESGSTPYDFFRVNLLNSSGAFLETLWSLDNSYGNYGIPGCGTWFILTSTIPSSYYGQTIRLAFEATTDVTLPTIFRIDDVSVMASTQAPTCTYTLSGSSYTCTNASANTYNNVVLVNTQSGCAWTATVLSGGSWLTTSSSGNGSGGINIIVSQNTNPSPRSGIVSVGNQSFTVTQPGADCTYTLSSNNYVCPNAGAGTLTSVALVNTQSNCAWSAVVTSGNSWMACSSSNSGSGAIDLIVQANPNSTPRNGTIAIQGLTFTVTQPAGSGTGIDQMNQASSFSAFPNPSNGLVSFAGATVNDLIEILDFSGRSAKLIHLNSAANVDVSDLAAGTYVVLNKSSNQTIKLIIQ